MQQNKRQLVGAVFYERQAASNAIDELLFAKFDNDQIHIVVREGDRLSASDEPWTVPATNVMLAEQPVGLAIAPGWAWSDEDAHAADDSLREGGIYIAVNAGQRTVEAKTILERNGGRDAIHVPTLEQV